MSPAKGVWMFWNCTGFAVQWVSPSKTLLVGWRRIFRTKTLSKSRRQGADGDEGGRGLANRILFRPINLRTRVDEAASSLNLEQNHIGTPFSTWTDSSGVWIVARSRSTPVTWWAL